MPTNQLADLCMLVAQNGDQVAFKKIFSYFYPKLFPFVKGLLKSQESAEEVMSDVFLKLWQSRQSLPAIQNLNYYLFVVSKHAAFDYIQKKQKIFVVSLDDLAVEFGEIKLNPEELCISAELLNKIQQAVAALPPNCRLIFRLVKEDGLKYREVAEMLNLSIKTVENQMSLALSKIGSELLAANAFPHFDLSRFAKTRSTKNK